MRQHPPEYCKPTDRFIVMIQIGTLPRGGGPAFEPLSYGMEGQPHPDQLLRRGCRATSFPSEIDATHAFAVSRAAWESAGITWHRNKHVQIVKVEIA